MYKPFQSFGAVYIVFLLSILLGISSCENPGSVGTGLTDPEAEVETDTIYIENFNAIQPNSYSGELSFFSAGYYNDPLFGSMEATAYLKPGLPAEDNEMDEDATMLMRILFDEDQVYGNASADQQYSVYEIDEAWRDRAVKIDDEIQIDTDQKVGEFTVGDEDSLDVELSADWVDKYRQYAEESDTDSLYRYEFHGLALVPDNESKIIPLNSNSTRFVIQNPQADTFDVRTLEWGYSLERTNNSTFPQGSVPVYSTYESVINFEELGVSDFDVPASGFSRAELVIYQNNSEMEQSMQSEPSTARRAETSTMHLQLADSTEIPESIDPGVSDSRATGNYSSNTGAYRFDITNLVERVVQVGQPEELEFFMTVPNDGVIKPLLIYTSSENVPVDKRPKIIITSLKKRNN